MILRKKNISLFDLLFISGILIWVLYEYFQDTECTMFQEFHPDRLFAGSDFTLFLGLGAACLLFALLLVWDRKN